MRNKQIRIILFVLVLALIICISSVCAFAENTFSAQVVHPTSSVYYPTYFLLGTDYSDPTTGSHMGYGDFSIPNGTVISRYTTYLPNNSVNRSYCVKAIQASLVKIYVYHTSMNCNPGAVDSIFGSQTDTAVRNFQSAVSITVDGYVGNDTWYQLQEHTFNQ